MGLVARGRVLFRVTPIVLAGACASAHVSNSPNRPETAASGSANVGAAAGTTTNNSTSPGTLGGTDQWQSSLPGCPGGNGIRISVSSGTGGDSSSILKTDTSSRLKMDTTSILNAVVDQRRSIDTTIVFDVAQKNWTRTNLAAAISAGLSDQARGGYMVCAGVSALIPSATLTIRGAKGRVHFAATLQDLLNSIRSGSGGTSPQLR
ncbi:MAG: hypothetical protein ABR585_15170, partial [Gemmatimonadaceae bacterium]